MIAVELVKSKSVLVIDREKRGKLLEEMEFGLSGLADPQKVAEIGKLLSADYLAFGDFIDMGGQAMVSMKLVQVETGQVAWADSMMESLSHYNAIAQFFSGSLVGTMAGASAAPATVPAQGAVKDETALMAFSKAVDAVDRGDKAEAKANLDLAKAKDPNSAAVAYYMAKLSGASPRFAVEIDPIAASYNPASLAWEEKIRLYYWSSTGNIIVTTDNPRNLDGRVIGPYMFNEAIGNQHLGGIIPLARGRG